MDIYQETEEGNFTFGNTTIPNTAANRHYAEMQAKVTAGEATIVPYVAPPPPPLEPVVLTGDVVASKKFILIDEQGVEHDATAAIMALI